MFSLNYFFYIKSTVLLLQRPIIPEVTKVFAQIPNFNSEGLRVSDQFIYVSFDVC